MGKKSIKTKKFLQQHPICCFCGGATHSVTQDHIPPRSYFIDSRHPGGLEFPSCRSCNNRTSNEEDIARLLSRIQGASFNSDLQRDFMALPEKYQKTAKLSGIQIQNTGKMVGSLELFQLGPNESESFITLSTKLVLGLHYKLLNKIVTPEQKISLIFYTADRDTDKIIELIDQMPGHPPDKALQDDKFSKQFYYRYLIFEEYFDKQNADGWEFLIGFHFHIGLLGLGIVYLNEDYLHDYDIIVRSPFSAV